MRGWATLGNLYAYWPSLASISEMTDERLRQHLDEAEEIVAADLQGLGFEPPYVGPRVEKILRRLTAIKALSTVLLYPFGDGGTPSRYTRAAQDFEARYQYELSWATRNYRALEGVRRRTPWGPISIEKGQR